MHFLLKDNTVGHPFFICKGGHIAERILNPDSREAQAAPERLRLLAQEKGRQIKQIVWDEAGGYPDFSWGYIQWSLRPYEQRQGCDGTVDLNVHLIGLRLCEELGLDYQALYEQAYRGDREEWDASWITDLEWDEVQAETIVPELSEQALRYFLFDLSEINNHALIDVAADAFTKLGYNVENWWEDE